jgi:hypothetical protein
MGTVTTDGPRDGGTYDDPLDHDRLNRQMRAVHVVMSDGNWHTLADLEAATGCPQASLSARLRDFRKDRFGANTVERRRVPFRPGVWEYRLVVTP